MSDHCPHCGSQLPVVRDAFCSECRQPLDEPPADRSSIQVGADRPSSTRPDIVGGRGLTWDEVANEVGRGARLVVFQYCVSVGIVTFRSTSRVHLVRAGESAVAKGWRYTLLSLLAGWWGIPWGMIYTPAAVARNLAGGTDVTASLVGHLLQGPLADLRTTVDQGRLGAELGAAPDQGRPSGFKQLPGYRKE